MQDTRVGFLEAQAEPVNFLSVDKVDKETSPSKNINGGFRILLTNNKNYYERQAYTFLGALGDFGGFNDAIVFLISSFMGVYSAKMYVAQIAAETPVFKKRSKASQESVSRLRDKMSRGERLGGTDMTTLQDYLVKGTEKLKTPFWTALCFSNLCYRRDRHLRIMHAAK